MVYLISQQQCSLPHGCLHLLVRYEPITLRRLAGAAWARYLERGEQTIHFARMVLHKFNGTGKLGPILYCHTAILLPRDDIVKFLRLEKGRGDLASSIHRTRHLRLGLIGVLPGGTGIGRIPLLW